MIEKPHGWTFVVRCLCAAACIVAGMNAPSTHAEDALGLSTIAKWDFGTDEDAQADRWPDGWTRRKDAQHPGYIPVQIDKKLTLGLRGSETEQLRRLMAKLYLAWQLQRSAWDMIPETIPAPIDKFIEHSVVDPFLRIDMDGSAAEIYSPKIAVDDDSLYSLQLDAMNSTDEFEAKGQLRFFDRKGNVIFQTETQPILGGSSTWTSWRTPGAYEAPSGIAAIQAAFIVRSRTAKATKATIGFDRIRILQMPKFRLQLDRATHLYRPNEEINVQLFASGLKKGTTRIELMLYDHEGNMIAKESKELTDSQTALASTRDSSQVAMRRESKYDWKIGGLSPGYYEIVTQVKRGATVFIQNTVNFAVVHEASSSSLDPRFGWSLDERVLQWRLEQLITLVREAGTGCIKIPIWFDANDPLAEDQLCETIDRIQAIGIRCVGVIHRPMTKQPSDSVQTSALDDPNVWQPLLEPVFRAMCLRLIDFQVGRDQDTQFGSNPRYEETLSWIKKILQRYGTEPTMTVAHNPWLHSLRSPSIDRWQWSIEETIAESEWTQAMTDATTRFPDWTCITPASAYQYSLPTRTQDLAARMIASIKPWNGRVSTGWVRKPFSDESGFLSPDGSPREMFLPYRTLLDAIKKREFAGEMATDGGSRNALLVSEIDSCMILWSSFPVTEQLYLGEQVDAIDVWGRSVDVEKVETPFGIEHRLQINKWPIILRGVDSKIAMWRMGLTMDQQRLDSLVGLPQTLQLRFSNPFPFGVSGRVDLVAPNIFANETESAPFDAAANAEATVKVNVLLRPDATSQDTPVRVVVSLNTSPAKRFSVAKTLRIGNDDVEFETAYRVSDNDELWLDLDAVNHTDTPVSFDCQLFIPDRRNERIQITFVDSRKTRTVVLPRASELMYKTLWLRCSQIGTRRILNYRIVIEPESNTGPKPSSNLTRNEVSQP